MRPAFLALALATAACGGGGDGSTSPPRPVVAKVVVTSDKATILVGGTAVLTASVQDAKGATISGRLVTWSTSNPSVAQVGAGTATGVGAGTANISASVDGVVGSAALTVVLPSVASVEVLGVSSTPLFPGQTAQLSALLKDSLGNLITGPGIAWGSSNVTVAAISIAGIVTAASPGTTTISATSGSRTGAALLTVATPTVTSVAITPTPMLVVVGGTATLVAVARNQQGGALAGQTFAYQSSDPTIASVSVAGVVSGIRPGAVTITATTQGVAGTDAVSVLVPTALAGRVYPADGSAATGLRFTAQTGTGAGLQSFAGPIDGVGAFRVDVPLVISPVDSLDLIIDVASGARTYRPIAARVPNIRAVTTALRPLLVPRTSTFSSPTYGASSMVVSLDQAFARVCTDNTNANCNSYFPQVWKTGVPLWSEAELPVPLAFNRIATTSPIGAADSTALWNVIKQMEADFGRPLFKPVNLADLPAPDANGYSSKAVLVSVDATLTGFAGYTNWFWDGSLNMTSAKTRVTQVSLLGNRSLMSHELLHALGFHHTCAWPTVMGGYGCSSAAGPTKADVAAFHLGYAVRRTIITNGPTTNFGDALRGEQFFESSPLAARGGAAMPIPFAERAYRVFLFHGMLVTGDGAP